jgi:hypothetical protein
VHRKRRLFVEYLAIEDRALIGLFWGAKAGAKAGGNAVTAYLSPQDGPIGVNRYHVTVFLPPLPAKFLSRLTTNLPA